MYESTYEAINREYDDLVAAHNNGELHQSEKQRMTYLEGIRYELGDEEQEMIAESDFTTYIENLIDECWEIPEQLTSGEWPWRHMKFDIEAAAEEAKQDYTEVEFDGVNYYCREM